MYDFNTLYEASSVEDALRLKKEHPQARILAGGSDILIGIRDGKLAGCDLISIYALDDLRGICLEDDGTLLIRPLTSFTNITMHPLIKEHLPVLGEAVDQIGGPQIRNIGTIGGNICNGVTSADSASTLKAYDAVLELTSLEGVRSLPYADFNLGAGKVDLRSGEMLTGIRIRKESWENTYGNYIKYSMRRAMDIATLACSVNVRLTEDKKRIDRLRIAFGVAAPTPIRAFTAEKSAQGHLLDKELLTLVSEGALADVMPRSSWRASKEFRLHLVEELARRATIVSIEKAGGNING
ncbi:aerobic-type carbon monoxide dehydrogenase, middle subunit CoxM/CutM-like protein [Sphaerochaeta pleomorpha str. Grapes]|uniref:Aerobic-type carbon monoxide dehydrogenase, middle subunit CoxM/CutM-like protein n=1 Tax=Sphaerochaeta pleomorpha (strain ATCC BAA-1885 / DSM 22778 / Grapes) TaxID=158190 RepID=G8QSK9_SPHPG|nr:xanthine dehydrogenase subunit XdhB [Sphaerochaeta pleomorpha]AEV28970.1 aerobic-type carbon monoxide dehydrogenase, middle subunit CoxM/CutM-like protein [Sphaerochaeta pleomorpha str. Grapes]